MRRGRILIAVAAAVALWAGAGPAFDRCEPPKVAAAWADPGQEGEGPLEAGAGRAAIHVPFPVVVGGYGPWRHEADRAVAPLFARAVVLKRGAVRIGVVNADVLLIPEELSLEVRRRARALGLSDVMVVATHAHTSLGGYDAHLVPQVAALGRFREEVKEALLTAMTGALQEAARSLAPARIEVEERSLPQLVRTRDPGAERDVRLTRIAFEGAKPIAQWLLFSAHPTTAGRAPGGVDPDYPGRLAALEETKGEGVTLFLPGSVGNASADGSARGPAPYAAAVERALSPNGDAPAPGDGATAEATVRGAPGKLRLDRGHATLPHPDARRLVPFGLRHLTEDLLCASAPESVNVAVLELGPLTLVGVPGEATFAAARALTAAVGPEARVVSLAGGYLGYVDSAEAVREVRGEAKRQYFGPELLDRLVKAAAATRRPQPSRD